MPSFKALLLGNPVSSRDESEHRLSIPLALSVFAADALSSVAFASEEILIAITASAYAASAGWLSLPVTGVIVLLIAIVTLSYLQVVTAYPENGGTYAVAKDRLGRNASLLAAAALLIDYILVVSVGVSAGVAAITSTGLIPADWAVPVALGFIGFMGFFNLRGVRESGTALAIPAYGFIAFVLLMVAVGSFQLLNPNMEQATTQLVSTLPLDGWTWTLMLVLLKAFSHGCSALTGIEAVSNGVQVFKPPVTQNAQKTLILIGVILAVMFLGIGGLAVGFHLLPKPNETLMSQIAAAVFGKGHLFYYAVQFITLAILVLSANTSFAGFPRLASIILAKDGYLPRQLTSFGDKLVYSNGILLLSVFSGGLVWLFHAETHALIPLFAIGVFLSFTLAQAGMVVLHWQERRPKWVGNLLINGIGMIVTAITTLILALEKFTEGAWIVLVAIPLFVWLFYRVKRHYDAIGQQIQLPERAEPFTPRQVNHTVLVLVSSVSQVTLPALEYAKSISNQVEAVHVAFNEESTEALKKAWALD